MNMRILILLGILMTTILPTSSTKSDELGAWYEHFKQQIPLLWSKDLRPSIEMSHQNINRRVLYQIQIRIKEDACELSARAGYAKDGTPEIVIPTGFIRLWLYSDNARLLFHSGDPRFNDPRAYVKYVISDMKDVINGVAETCATRNAGVQGSVIGQGFAKHLGIDPRDYQNLLRLLKRQPEQVALGNQFGYGMMFTILHEAGHLLFKESEGLKGEYEMDRFAAEVLRHQRKSTFLAIGAIAVTALVKSATSSGCELS